MRDIPIIVVDNLEDIFSWQKALATKAKSCLIEDVNMLLVSDNLIERLYNSEPPEKWLTIFLDPSSKFRRC